MERFGVRRVVALALAAGRRSAPGLTLVMTSAWQLWFLWGVAVGIGTGAMALVFGAIVANRWFVRHRGLVIGVFSAASSTGQLIFLPAIAQLAARPRLALGRRAGRRLRAAPRAAGLLVLRDRPSDVGDHAVRRARVVRRAAGRRARTRAPARLALTTLREVSRTLDLLGAVR